MFTGLIEEIGRIVAWQDDGQSARLTVHAPLVAADAAHGDSIAVSGVCLTVIERQQDAFTADVIGTTLDGSTLRQLGEGSAVNLERAAAAGQRLGGHIVQGHVDGTARILEIRDSADWRLLRISLDPDLAPLVARKGSITLDGTSLTVSETGRDWFEVALIPETLRATTFGQRREGDPLNVETDLIARHALRFAEFGLLGTGDRSTTAEGAR